MTIEKKRIVITGGAGFIGSTLAGRLADHNDIVQFDNLVRNMLQHRNLIQHRNVMLVQGDILDYDATRRAMEGAQIVVHAAAIAGIDTVLLKSRGPHHGSQYDRSDQCPADRQRCESAGPRH